MTNKIIDARIVIKSSKIEEMVSPFLEACKSVMGECAAEAKASYETRKKAAEIFEEIFKLKYHRNGGNFGLFTEFENFTPYGYREANGFKEMAGASVEVEISHLDLSLLNSFNPENAKNHLINLRESRKIHEEILADKIRERDEILAMKEKEAEANMEAERLKSEILTTRKEIASIYETPREPIAPWAWVSIVVMIVCAVLFIASK